MLHDKSHIYIITNIIIVIFKIQTTYTVFSSINLIDFILDFSYIRILVTSSMFFVAINLNKIHNGKIT